MLPPRPFVLPNLVGWIANIVRVRIKIYHYYNELTFFTRSSGFPVLYLSNYGSLPFPS